MARCTFCGKGIAKGTGLMYVEVSGAVKYFCSTKCKKNLLELRRKPRSVAWTQESRDERVKEK